MGGSSPKPDKNIGRAAMASARTGQDMLAWMQDQAKVTNAWAAEDRARYKSTFEPLQDSFIREAQTFASPARKAMAANEAGADVRLATNQQIAADNRRLTAMGIDPRSGRARDFNRGAAMDAGLAVAGARNMARPWAVGSKRWANSKRSARWPGMPTNILGTRFPKSSATRWSTRARLWGIRSFRLIRGCETTSNSAANRARTS